MTDAPDQPRETIADFIARTQIRAMPQRIEARTDSSDDDDPKDQQWQRDARHWLVTLSIIGRGPRAVLAVQYSQGSAHKKAPTAADVLDSLASDAAGIENARGFEDWAAEYGYERDSRKAERLYRTCERLAARLRKFLGAEDYKSLLWNVDRQ